MGGSNRKNAKAAKTEQKNKKQVELFIAARNISRHDEKAFDSFAVVSIKQSGDRKFQELDRTETLTACVSPEYCTSMILEYEELDMPWTQVCVDMYERKSSLSEKLENHLHRGTSQTTVAEILHAPSMQYSGQLYNPMNNDKVGILYVRAEQTGEGDQEIHSMVQLDVCVSLLRRRDWNKTAMSQRYELCRMHRFADEDGEPVWLPIHRSDRMSRRRDSNTKIEFSSANVTMRHFCNGDEQRNMKLMFYAAPLLLKQVGHRRVVGPELCVATAEFTMRSVCEMDPTEEVLQMENENGHEDVGYIVIDKAEPTDFGSHFSLMVKHETTERYVSSMFDCKVDERVMKRRKITRKASLLQNTSRGLSKESRLDSATIGDLFSMDSLDYSS